MLAPDRIRGHTPDSRPEIDRCATGEEFGFRGLIVRTSPAAPVTLIEFRSSTGSVGKPNRRLVIPVVTLMLKSPIDALKTKTPARAFASPATSGKTTRRKTLPAFPRAGRRYTSELGRPLPTMRSPATRLPRRCRTCRRTIPPRIRPKTPRADGLRRRSRIKCSYSGDRRPARRSRWLVERWTTTTIPEAR